ncbi:MAG: A24 family peptidase, partial [Planctomycetaceae bacterium]|jgi:prepilin signal peptidase PulO-like enzyme (type II secretory pathway)|nr:A24 family peptidase [Planctomycetaceae bacterium]
MPFIQVVVKPTAVPLNVCSPNEANLPQRGTGASVIVALWLFWCFAMLPRVWYFKLPVRKAAAIFCRYLKRSPLTPWLAVLAISGTAYLYWLMQTPFAGSPKHLALLSALTGCAAGMIIIWGVRIIGSAALGREAMGFGDVTLMGMIGVYVGWQSCILIFFLAPFAGLILGIANFILGKGKEFPYGPFLCLATVFLVVFWRTVWTAAAPVFELGWFVAAGMGVCLVMLGVMLGIWRLVKEKFLP